MLAVAIVTPDLPLFAASNTIARRAGNPDRLPSDFLKQVRMA